MQKLLAGISAAAGAIVGLVKLIGLATGSQWLGDNWKPTLGYVSAVFLAMLGTVYLALAVIPRCLERFGLHQGLIFPRSLRTPRLPSRAIVGLYGLVLIAACLDTVF